jgi:hypothetical protein
LVIDGKTGANPYKFGFIGSTDFHSGLSTSDENAFDGQVGIDPTKDLPEGMAAAKVLSRTPNAGTAKGYDRIDNGSGNLAGVWAEQNTRESIYSALRRKETFATSGTRLKFRFFGGWNYDRSLLKSSEWVRTAYAQGVPMGGDLPAKPAATPAPRFIVWAAKDPDGANLDRVQVVKVWLEDGRPQEKVFNVAVSANRKIDGKSGLVAAVGTTVDVKTATYKNSIGATELSAVWQDPEFTSAAAAVYYLRVIEIPTPRWSTILAVKRGLPLTPETPATVQERGWSSPIWYSAPAQTGKERR